MSGPARPGDNPFNAQRIDALAYIEFDIALAAVAQRLQKHRYRGALVGPHGCGKTALLQAVGDELMRHGLTPLPLFINSDHRGRLPRPARHTIGHARHTDALLLDGYDLLPMRTRAWVLLASRRAGALIVTTHRRVRLPTVAQPIASPAVLQRLIQQLAPEVDGKLDAAALYHQAGGNLREALRLCYDRYADLQHPRSG